MYLYSFQHFTLLYFTPFLFNFIRKCLSWPNSLNKNLFEVQRLILIENVTFAGNEFRNHHICNLKHFDWVWCNSFHRNQHVARRRIVCSYYTLLYQTRRTRKTIFFFFTQTSYIQNTWNLTNLYQHTIVLIQTQTSLHNLL